METNWSDARDVTAELTRSLSALRLSPTRTVTPLPGTPKSLEGLPTEIILEIYKHFDHISQIVALNSTSRMFYEIWRLDPATISSAVLPRSIEFYDATVEIEEAEERQQKLDPYGRCDPLKALERLLSDCLATSPISSNVAAYAATLASNRRLVCIAQKAEMIPELCKGYFLQKIGRERIILAFYQIWHFTIRNSRKFTQLKSDLKASVTLGDDRVDFLSTMDVQKRDDMARVGRFLVYDCPGENMVKLGISYVESREKNPAKSPRCVVEPYWVCELIRIAIGSRDMATFNLVVLTNRWHLYKDC